MLPYSLISFQQIKQLMFSVTPKCVCLFWRVLSRVYGIEKVVSKYF